MTAFFQRSASSGLVRTTRHCRDDAYLLRRPVLTFLLCLTLLSLASALPAETTTSTPDNRPRRVGVVASSSPLMKLCFRAQSHSPNSIYYLSSAHIPIELGTTLAYREYVQEGRLLLGASLLDLCTHEVTLVAAPVTTDDLRFHTTGTPQPNNRANEPTASALSSDEGTNEADGVEGGSQKVPTRVNTTLPAGGSFSGRRVLFWQAVQQLVSSLDTAMLNHTVVQRPLDFQYLPDTVNSRELGKTASEFYFGSVIAESVSSLSFLSDSPAVTRAIPSLWSIITEQLEVKPVSISVQFLLSVHRMAVSIMLSDANTTAFFRSLDKPFVGELFFGHMAIVTLQILAPVNREEQLQGEEVINTSGLDGILNHYSIGAFLAVQRAVTAQTACTAVEPKYRNLQLNVSIENGPALLNASICDIVELFREYAENATLRTSLSSCQLMAVRASKPAQAWASTHAGNELGSEVSRPTESQATTTTTTTIFTHLPFTSGQCIMSYYPSVSSLVLMSHLTWICLCLTILVLVVSLYMLTSSLAFFLCIRGMLHLPRYFRVGTVSYDFHFLYIWPSDREHTD